MISDFYFACKCADFKPFLFIWVPCWFFRSRVSKRELQGPTRYLSPDLHHTNVEKTQLRFIFWQSRRGTHRALGREFPSGCSLRLATALGPVGNQQVVCLLLAVKCWMRLRQKKASCEVALYCITQIWIKFGLWFKKKWKRKNVVHAIIFNNL